MNRHLIILILLLHGLWCGYGQVSYMPDDPAVMELKTLYLESGKVFPTGSFPLDRRDLHRLALKLEEQALSSEAREKVAAFLEELSFNREVIRLGTDVKFTYEHYLRTDEEWEDYYRLFFEPEAALAFDLYYTRDGLAVIDIAGSWRREYDGFSPNNFFSFKPGNPFAHENQFLQKGYFRYFFGPLEMELGRNKVHYGPSKYSSLLLSQRLPFLDALRLRLPIGSLEMTSLVSTLENREAAEDLDLVTLNDNDPSYLDDYDFVDNTIICAMHRFEYSFKRLRLGISGLSFITRPDNAFLLGDFFPVFSWHTADVGWHNLSMIGDVSLAPLPGLEIFAQYGVDDISLGSVNVGDDPLPTIDAYIVGLSFDRLLLKANFSFYLEGGYTHYLWGNFHEEYALSRAIYRYFMDHENQILPMTSPFGPGSRWIYGEIGWGNLNNVSASLFFQLIDQNTLANLIDTPYETSSEVENASRTTTMRLGLELRYAFKKALTVYMKPVLLYQDPYFWGELTLGCTLRHRGESKIKP